MKLLTKTKIEKACGQHDARYALNYVFYDYEEKALVATNGHIMAINPIEVDEHDTPGLIPPEVIAHARTIKPPRYRAPEHVIKCFDKFEFVNSDREYKRPNHKITFPKYKQAFGKEPEKPFTVALNANLLKTLMEAICETSRTSGVALTFDTESPLAPIKVEPLYGDTGNYGYLMPMRDSRSQNRS